MHSCSHPEPQDQTKASGQLHALADALSLEVNLLVAAEQARCILEPRWRKENPFTPPDNKRSPWSSTSRSARTLVTIETFYCPSKQQDLFSKQLSYWKA
jgi:hypothetical protein